MYMYRNDIYTVVASVLHLGNVTFGSREGSHGDEESYITSERTIDLVSKFLRVDSALLHKVYLFLSCIPNVLKRTYFNMRRRSAERSLQ